MHGIPIATSWFGIQSRNACGTSFPFITRLLDCSNFPLNNSAPSIGRNPVKGDGDWRGSSFFSNSGAPVTYRVRPPDLLTATEWLDKFLYVCSLCIFSSVFLWFFFLGIMTKLWKKNWTEQNSKLNERTLELQITDRMTKYVKFVYFQKEGDFKNQIPSSISA